MSGSRQIWWIIGLCTDFEGFSKPYKPNKNKKDIRTRILWECGPWIVRSAWKVARMLPGWKGRPARSSEGHLGRKDRQTRRIQHIINNFLVQVRNFVTDPGTCLASLNGTVGLECRQKVNMDVGSALEFAKMTAKAEMSARAGMEVIAIGCCECEFRISLLLSSHS